MMSRNAISTMRRWLVAWMRRQPLPLKCLIVGGPLVLTTLVDEALKNGANATGVAEWQLAAMFILSLVLLALLSIPFFSLRPVDPMPPIELAQIKVQRVFNTDELALLRTGLHGDIYGGVAPLDVEVEEMYRRNPRMGVGLFDPARSDFVAFATGWPLSEQAARKLLVGAMSENDLTAQDILPESENGRCKFVLVPAFGAASTREKGDRAALGIKLYYEFRRALRENFFPHSRRRLTIIASGFSEDGRELCRTLGMAEYSSVVLDERKAGVPVFAREITLQDVS